MAVDISMATALDAFSLFFDDTVDDCICASSHHTRCRLLFLYAVYVGLSAWYIDASMHAFYLVFGCCNVAVLFRIPQMFVQKALDGMN